MLGGVSVVIVQDMNTLAGRFVLVDLQMPRWLEVGSSKRYNQVFYKFRKSGD